MWKIKTLKLMNSVRSTNLPERMMKENMKIYFVSGEVSALKLLKNIIY